MSILDYNSNNRVKLVKELSATYSIVKGLPQAIGDKVKVDGSGIATNSKGIEMQLNFPDDQLLEMEVSKLRKDGNLELKTQEDFVIEIKENLVAKTEKFGPYRLIKGATFIYDKKYNTLNRKQ